MSGMAGLASRFRLNRIQSTDVQAAAMWGVAAGTGALYLVQPWNWLRKTFWEKAEEEQK
ncbi:Ubiquinol-cytochrome c reductase complex 6.7 kDa protein [Senna tora]|uniref:Ubiquinol-cytochrome c reductase complex 6.7 kDa protein n=1 Tax=Senna tora TaxID=362788 RepID=A0A834WR40_9FABA|nr:Ubiquinol-cytochrome c reductase complex 6.7 kDa protein [Senna tora]